MRLQAVFLGQDEPGCGKDRHDSTAALPAHRRTTGIRGGGSVPGFRGERKGKMTSGSTVWPFESGHHSCVFLLLCCSTYLDPMFISLSLGGEGVVSSLPAPANPQSEAPRSRKEGGVRGQSENRN